jgi:diadenosine tetraphosphate (Ap4A) HIT family hydrolase
VREWLRRLGVETLFIEPGSPWENGYVESFIGKLRDELLNREIFYTLKEATILIEQWRRHYNGVRPHSALGYRPPAPETIAFPGRGLPNPWSSLETSGGLLHSVNRDDTDFRSIRESYRKREKDCAFCNLPSKRIVMDNNLAMSLHDGYPVSPLHSLIIPKRHVADFFDLGTSEMKACNDLLQKTKDTIKEEDNTVVGFNVGVNVGEAAGQTIFHCHIHLIPRRKGDVENPCGGVRHVMPGKGYYRVDT